MWKTGVVASLFLCISCGPSETEKRLAELQNQADADNRSDIENAAALANRQAESEECRKKQDSERAENADRIHLDQNLIMSTIGQISKSGSNEQGAVGFGLTVEIESLDATSWRWTEFETLAAAENFGDSGSRSDKVSYTVDPRTLLSSVAVTTYLGLPAISFSCAQKDCIRAVGRRVVDRNGDRSLVDIDEVRNANSWALDTNSRASALADTMGDLIRRQNVRSTANCDEPVRYLGGDNNKAASDRDQSAFS